MMDPKQGLKVLLLIITLASYHESHAAGRHDVATNHPQQIVLYATSWCGYCQKAREFLARNRIQYVEYDIEKSSEGKRQFAQLRGTGVPLILVGTEQIRGWNPRALTAALARARRKASAPAPAAPDVDRGSALAAPADDTALAMSKLTFITPSSDSEHRYIIHLRDLQTLKVNEYWEEGDEIKYKKFGGIIGVQRKDVVMIENTADGTKKRYKRR